MHSATFAAFHDELIKIADIYSDAGVPNLKMSPADVEKHYGSAPQRTTKVHAVPGGSGRGTTQLQLTESRVVPSDAFTKAHNLESTVARSKPASAAGTAVSRASHTPTRATGGMLRRVGSGARAHAAPLAVGAGVLALGGAVALRKMRKQDASSR